MTVSAWTPRPAGMWLTALALSVAVVLFPAPALAVVSEVATPEPVETEATPVETLAPAPATPVSVEPGKPVTSAGHHHFAIPLPPSDPRSGPDLVILLRRFVC